MLIWTVVVLCSTVQLLLLLLLLLLLRLKVMCSMDVI
jgi:hypothetical protein